MDLRQLRYFLDVFERGGASAAADHLHIAQSAVSRAITNLETELGAPLFLRTGRGLSPTPAGKQLALRANEILRAVEFAKAEISALHDKISGRIKIGLPHSFGGDYAVSLLKEAGRRWPDLNVSLAESYSGYVHDWIIEKRIDIAILNHEIAHGRDLSISPFCSDEIVAVFPAKARKGATIDFAALADLPVILPDHQHGLRRLIDKAAAQAGVRFKSEYEINSVTMIKDLVIGGDFVAILPPRTVARDVKAGMLKTAKIRKPAIKRELVIATSQARENDLAVTAMTALMRELVNHGG